MSTTSVTRSSWISSLSYFTAPDGTRYLAVFTQQHTAFLFANVPSYLPGLIAAGVWKRDDDGRSGHFSPGRAFHRFLRSQPRYAHQYLSTREQLHALDAMITACEKTARERPNATPKTMPPFWSPSLPTVRVSTRVGFRGRSLVVSCLAPSLDPHCPADECPTAWSIALRRVSSIPVPMTARSGEESFSMSADETRIRRDQEMRVDAETAMGWS